MTKVMLPMNSHQVSAFASGRILYFTTADPVGFVKGLLRREWRKARSSDSCCGVKLGVQRSMLAALLYMRVVICATVICSATQVMTPRYSVLLHGRSPWYGPLKDVFH